MQTNKTGTCLVLAHREVAGTILSESSRGKSNNKKVFKVSKLIKFSSIGQFRNIVKDINDYYQDQLPTLVFHGTVKVHGTNASVVINSDKTQYAQSRNNVLSATADNSGFAVWHLNKRPLFAEYAAEIRAQEKLSNQESIILYGEWAGKGIQSGVAVCELDKFFYLFGVKVLKGEDHYWVKGTPSFIHSSDICDAKSVWQKNIEIDFNDPEKVQNELVALTNLIETECPVGKHFGVSGIGEGIVYEHIDSQGKKISFKVKGEKHSISKVKKLASIDPERIESISKFVEYAVTENRLNQGFNEVCNNEADRAFLGQFIKWVSSDILKEENDTLLANGLTIRDVGSALSKKARNWFFDKELV